MKYTALVFLAILVMAACNKISTEPEIIVEPPEPVEVRLDSIEEGSMYNVTIGDPSEKVYNDLQFFAKGMKQTPYLSIGGFVYEKIEHLEGRIPLYGSLIFDRKPSAKEGGQIYFEGNTIKSIYNRAGTKLTSWPRSSPDALRVGDGASGSGI